MKITIYGNPIGKARPKFARRGKHTMAYNPKESEEGLFAMRAKAMLGGKKPLQGAVAVHAEYFLPRPKGHYGTGKNSSKLKPSAPRHVLKKPDLDNLLKFSWDALNGVAWLDDSQVVESSESKRWADDGLPRTEISIWPLD